MNTSNSGTLKYFGEKYERTNEILNNFEKNFNDSHFLGLSHKASKNIHSPSQKHYSIENHLNKRRVYDSLYFYSDTSMFKALEEDKLSELKQIFVNISEINININEKAELFEFEKYWGKFFELGFETLNRVEFFKNLIMFQDIFLAFYHYFFVNLMKFEDDGLKMCLNEMRNKMRFLIQNLNIMLFSRRNLKKNIKKLIEEDIISLKYNANVIQSTVLAKLNEFLAYENKFFINKGFFSKINKIFST